MQTYRNRLNNRPGRLLGTPLDRRGGWAIIRTNIYATGCFSKVFLFGRVMFRSSRWAKIQHNARNGWDTNRFTLEISWKYGEKIAKKFFLPTWHENTSETVQISIYIKSLFVNVPKRWRPEDNKAWGRRGAPRVNHENKIVQISEIGHLFEK